MAKRHGSGTAELEGLFLRLEELVIANSAEDPFEVIFKLLIAKLWDERSGRESRFKFHDSNEATHHAIESLLREADTAWPGTVERPLTIPLTPAHLVVCVQPLVQVSLTEASLEVMDALFEFLVSKSAKGAKGQYFTPRHVVEFCVRVIAPQPGETILDPACGSGGFLFHAFNYVNEQHGLDSKQSKKFASTSLWGFDFDARATRIARALLVFAGASTANIFRLNSLLKPDMAGLFRRSDLLEQTNLTIEDINRTRFRRHKGYDVILTNPPFAGEVKETEYINSYKLAHHTNKVERDVLFIERCVELLRPGGRMAIVLPDNKFSARSYQYVREWLLKNTRVLGAVGLGRHTFLPHTHQKASILFVKKSEEEITRNHNIFFAISERAGKNSRGQPILRQGTALDQSAWNRLDHDLGEIEMAFKDFFRSESIQLGGG